MIYGRFIVTDPNYLARLNSIHRFHVRQIEKNRFPIKCHCAVCGEHFLCRGIEQYLRRQYYLGPDKDGNVQHVCWSCDLPNKVKIAAGTLYHLISAIPQAERDRNEIYPGDFCKARIAPPPHDWRGPSDLRDYSEPTRLLNKFGKYEFAYRQMGGPVWTGRDSHVALWLLQQLTTPEQQRALESAGRLFKDTCYWRKWPSTEEKRTLFDKCQGLSWQKARLWKPGQVSFQLDDPAVPNIDIWRAAKSGGQVEILGSPAKRHVNLAKTQADYNEQSASYWNVGRTKKSGWDFGIRAPNVGIAGGLKYCGNRVASISRMKRLNCETIWLQTLNATSVALMKQWRHR
jgi:hypothetical protein